jgi:hypothetical protein
MHLHFFSEKASDGRLLVGRQGVSPLPAKLSGRFIVIRSEMVTVVAKSGGKVPSEAKKAEVRFIAVEQVQDTLTCSMLGASLSGRIKEEEDRARSKLNSPLGIAHGSRWPSRVGKSK